MLRKQEELEINGVMAGQKLADELYGMKMPQESALPATTLLNSLKSTFLTAKLDSERYHKVS